MGQKQDPNNLQSKAKQIRVLSRAKKKKLFSSGLLKKKGHLSSSTRIKQAKKDQLIFGTSIKDHIIEMNSPLKSETLSMQESKDIETMKFVKIPTSRALDTYVRRHCNGLLKRVSAKPNKYNLKFRVQPIAKNYEGAISHFQVDGVIDITGRKSLRATSKGTNVRQVVDKTIESLEKQVRRETEKKERSRKTMGKSLQLVREYSWEFSYDQKE